MALPRERGALERWVAPACLLLVAAAVAPSLPGGFVWDDHSLVAANPVLDHPLRALASDLFGPATGERSDVYRPLFVLSLLPGHALGLGAGFERLVNLGLHLGAVALLARLGVALGAGHAAAWLGAAAFGAHPGSLEAVAWIAGRQESLALLALLGATLAWARGRGALAGALLALAPFAKESMLVAPAVAGAWMLGDRRPRLAPLAGALAGAGAYLGVRAILGIPVPAGAALLDPLGALGAALVRWAGLLALPWTADALPPYHPRPLWGAAAVALGLALAARAVGRRRVAAVLGLLLPVVPGALAAAHTGLVSDRYALTGLAAAGLLLGFAVGGRRWPAGALLAVALGFLGARRAGDWTSDRALFAASLARDPANAAAAFHVAHDLHVRGGDCAAAVPLYRRGLGADPRAGTNLLACLVALGRLDEALAAAPEAVAASPTNANAPANAARAAALAGRLDEAERWAREALARDPDHGRTLVLLGNVLGQRGRCAEALPLFERAAGLPDLPESTAAAARRGLAACRRRLAAPPPAPPGETEP